MFESAFRRTFLLFAKKKIKKDLDRINLLLIFIVLNNLNIKSYESKN